MLPERFSEEDRELITGFVERVKRWAPPTLDAIVLFGSMAREDFHRGSDIDFLLVFDEENPGRHLPEIVKIITGLEPHREIRPALTNLKDVSPALLKDALREGIVLHGKIIATPEDLALRSYQIISYDLSDVGSTVRQRVARRVYGYTSRKKVGEQIKEYRYEGLRDRRDCYILGKGVVALPRETAKGFIEFLKNNRVKVTEHEVFL
ncbi:MAG: nucleotidyltransferase domain-containing protein [Methanocellales archaeon]|nr:nucleotidyltransferase domain-containing protein [Methanocellales archaeon]